MLEVFSGSGHLTVAVRRLHPGACLPGVDLNYGPMKIDLADGVAVDGMLHFFGCGIITYVHFGTPCSSFSSALRGAARVRSASCPGGDESVQKCCTGNALARFTSAAVHVLHRNPDAWSIENPLTSLIWRCFLSEAPLPPHCRVRIDQCQYGLQIPCEGLARKATILVTNYRPLERLGARCRGGHVQVPLEGSFFDFEVKQRWRSRTEFAGAYPLALCKAWAGVLEPAIASRRKDLVDVMKALLLRAGDIEPHPGPPASRPGRGAGELFTSDVTQTTATAYVRSLERFEEFLRVRGICSSAAELVAEGKLVEHVLWYLRISFASRELGPSSVGTLISAIARFLNLSRALGVPVSIRDHGVGPLWKSLRTWRTVWPHEFRKPVHVEVALAIAAFFWTCRPQSLGLWTLITFQCMLRPTEGMSIQGGDFYEIPSDQRWRYSAVAGVLGLRRPKTARLPAHAARQYVTIEDRSLVETLCRPRIRPAFVRLPSVSPGGERGLHFHWARACTALGL